MESDCDIDNISVFSKCVNEGTCSLQKMTAQSGRQFCVAGGLVYSSCEGGAGK